VKIKAKYWVFIVLALFALYLGASVRSAARLIGTGSPLAVTLGVVVLGLPALGALILIREIVFGATTEAMAKELEAQGLLPEDKLPRRPSGRIVREAADADFVRYREEAEANPERWQSWHRLALAYDAAGDRSRARNSMKRAMRLRKQARA